MFQYSWIQRFLNGLKERVCVSKSRLEKNHFSSKLATLTLGPHGRKSLLTMEIDGTGVMESPTVLHMSSEGGIKGGWTPSPPMWQSDVGWNVIISCIKSTSPISLQFIVSIWGGWDYIRIGRLQYSTHSKAAHCVRLELCIVICI